MTTGIHYGVRGVARYKSMYRRHYFRGIQKMLIYYIDAAAF